MLINHHLKGIVKMNIKTILFDLDGTLLPMDQDLFVKTYLGNFAKKLAPLGYDPEAFYKAMWAGVGAMVKNNGSVRNDEAFWNTFCGLLGEHVRNDEPVFDDFYHNEFQKAKEVCGFNPDSAKVVHALKAAGYRVVLATNPLFPAIATESRIRWAGLEPEDFEYYTVYNNSCHCKPNPAYYQDITKKLDLNPEECLMVGNDVDEDMIAETLGMKVFLLTDSLINKHNKDIHQYPHGDFKELLKYLGL